MRSTPHPILLGCVILAAACAAPPPLARLQDTFKDYREYSISLGDMKEEGNFFKEYYHQYKIVYGQAALPATMALTTQPRILGSDRARRPRATRNSTTSVSRSNTWRLTWSPRI